jgi:hypothetical protein
MTRFVLAALVLLSCAVFATELSAQAGQVINPVPSHTAEREYSNQHMSDRL